MQYPNFNNSMYQVPQGQQNNSIVWVQGEEAAKAYPIAPGNTVLLMDSENPVIYIKRADLSGRPMQMEIYDMVRRDPKQTLNNEQMIDLSGYVKMEELDNLIEEKVKKFINKNKQNYKKKGDAK